MLSRRLPKSLGLKGPPSFFLDGRFDDLFGDQKIPKVHFLLYEGVNGRPIRQASDITVINEKIGFDFSRKMLAGSVFFLEVFVDGKEAYSALLAEVYGFLEKIAFAHAPEDEAVPIFHELAEG